MTGNESFEKKDGAVCDKCDGAKWGCMGGGHFCKYKILKKFFYLILLIVVFCFGMQLGELKTLSSIMYHSGGYNNSINNAY